MWAALATSFRKMSGCRRGLTLRYFRCIRCSEMSSPTFFRFFCPLRQIGIQHVPQYGVVNNSFMIRYCISCYPHNNCRSLAADRVRSVTAVRCPLTLPPSGDLPHDFWLRLGQAMIGAPRDSCDACLLSTVQCHLHSVVDYRALIQHSMLGAVRPVLNGRLGSRCPSCDRPDDRDSKNGFIRNKLVTVASPQDLSLTLSAPTRLWGGRV